MEIGVHVTVPATNGFVMTISNNLMIISIKRSYYHCPLLRVHQFPLGYCSLCIEARKRGYSN